ncbi:DNA cytosine methyltransferase [Zophobihabitans entericus]|nr:DNA cytosine methyltransferase [Zophobihabitans entericus]
MTICVAQAGIIGGKKKQFQLQKKYSLICNKQSKAITLTSRMYANWQGNFLDVSHHFISEPRLNKFLPNNSTERYVGSLGNVHQSSRVYNTASKSITLTHKTNPTGLYLQQDNFHTLSEGTYIRRLDPIECERLQTLPDNYSKGVSDTQRYKALGNGWTVDVIAHILSQLS